jgi:hypothetical protein
MLREKTRHPFGAIALANLLQLKEFDGPPERVTNRPTQQRTPDPVENRRVIHHKRSSSHPARTNLTTAASTSAPESPRSPERADSARLADNRPNALAGKRNQPPHRLSDPETAGDATIEIGQHRHMTTHKDRMLRGNSARVFAAGNPCRVIRQL